MNLAEKLAATYLRLNGFLLLPEFTVFDAHGYDHVDLIGLRAAGSVECVQEGRNELCEFPVDEEIFARIAERVIDPKTKLLGVAAEVKTNKDHDRISADFLAYLRKFLGGAETVRIVFRETDTDFAWVNDHLEIAHAHVIDWMLHRISEMDNILDGKTKVSSWTWSESALSDFLALHKLGALRKLRH